MIGLYALHWRDRGIEHAAGLLTLVEALNLIDRIQERGVFFWTLTPYRT